MKLLEKIFIFIIIASQSAQVCAYIASQVQAFKKVLQSKTQIANCANCDFRGVQELAGLDAHGAHMPGATFQPCFPTLINQNSVMVCRSGQVANMTGINLANANLFSVCLDGAILDNADLSGADLTSSSAQSASFLNAKFNGIITNNATFCNATMPDGKICTDTWSGQGVSISCNCTAQNSIMSDKGKISKQ